MRKSNLKAVPAEKPEPLDWYLIDRLACGLATDLLDSPEIAKTVMLLFQEVSRHALADNSHVESIANHVNMRLFSATLEADRAFDELMEMERTKLA